MKIKGAVTMKNDRINYIDEAMYLAKGKCAPGQYQPKRTFLEKKVVGLSWKPPPSTNQTPVKELGPG